MKWSYSLLFLFFGLIAQTQDRSPKSLEYGIEYNRAFVFKHKPTLIFDIPDYSQTLGARLRKYFTDTIGWEQYWGNPNFVVDITWTDFGDPDVLGHAWSIIPGIEFYIFRKSNTSLRFNLSSGLGYINRLYHPITNATNTSISSHFNNNTKLSFDLSLPEIFNLDLDLIFGLSHFSNGKSKLPNSGINYYHLGLRYIFNRSEARIVERDIAYHNLKKIGLDMHMAIAGSTSENIGGPQYEVYVFGLTGFYRFSDYFIGLLGGEREFHGPSYYYFLRDFNTETEAKNKATKYIVNIGAEMVLGKFSTKYIVGYYLPKEEAINNEAIFFRLQTSFYPLGLERLINPYVGIALKSHFGVADYISLHFGAKW